MLQENFMLLHKYELNQDVKENPKLLKSGNLLALQCLMSYCGEPNNNFVMHVLDAL
jgi:hypothetical protein